jgi:hypothetical protein
MKIWYDSTGYDATNKSFFTQTFLTAGVDPSTADIGRRGQPRRSGLTLFFRTKNLQEKTSDYGMMQSMASHREEYQNTNSAVEW